jgi:aryl-alcohol dehydrogenase-like predicted oxidoreductase
MEYVEIAGAGLRVSRIGLGTWAMGGAWWGGSDDREAVRTVVAALERGVNLVDTAPAYGRGRAEEIVGRGVREHGSRHDAVIATKAGLDWSGGAVVRNADPARIRAEVEDSLRRLRTDYLDLCQVHWPDPAVPLEDTARVLEALVREGKVRAVGVSNFSPAQIEAFRAGGVLHTCQPPYNLFEREAEAEVLPHCREAGIVTLAYGVLCRGLLSGRMRPDTRFPEDDLRHADDPKFQPPRFDQYLAAVERLDALARRRWDRRVLHLAVRWALDQPGVDVVLWGGRRPEQLGPVPEVFGWAVDDEARAEVDAILAETVTDPVGAEFMAPPG